MEMYAVLLTRLSFCPRADACLLVQIPAAKFGRTALVCSYPASEQPELISHISKSSLIVGLV
jgi:hypothetical protein